MILIGKCIIIYSFQLEGKLESLCLAPFAIDQASPGYIAGLGFGLLLVLCNPALPAARSGHRQTKPAPSLALARELV